MIRLAPPLILTAEQADAFLAALPAALDRAAPGDAGVPSAVSGAAPLRRSTERWRLMIRHFLRDDDLTPAEQSAVLDLAARMKADRFAPPAAGRAALGGGAVRQAEPADPDLVRRRHRRTRRAPARGGHPGHPLRPGRVARRRGPGAVPLRRRRSCCAPTATSGLAEIAAGVDVPVVNALTDGFHPCQLLADLLTIRERCGGTAGRPWRTSATRPTTWPTRTCSAGATAGMHVRVAGPAGFDPYAERGGPGRRDRGR